MSLTPSGWKSEARIWICPRPTPSSIWPPPYISMPLAVAVVVAGEQRLDRAEARRLDVDGLGRERERLDVGDRVDRRVPGDAVAVGLEHGVGLGVGEVGVLEPRVGQRLGDPAVERGVGVDVDRRALVGALEVDRGDRAGLDELLDQLAGPVRASPSSLKRSHG